MDRMKMISRNGIVVLFVLVLLGMNSIPTEAATLDFATKLIELQAKFPEDKYWNHVGTTQDNSDGYTDTACYLHKTAGVSHTYGTNGCVCNHFAGGGHLSATQCMGFANKLGYDVFGETTWTRISAPTVEQIADIRIGDIVRLDYDSHSVFVIARNGNVVTVGEANYTGPCQISWDRTIDLSTANITYYERAANYQTVLGDQTVVTPPVTEPSSPSEDNPNSSDEKGDPSEEGNSSSEDSDTEKSEGLAPATVVASDFTGWQVTVDGIHYLYYKKGVLQKDKWVHVNKKAYYVDANGCRVTGFYDIKEHTYYFNEEGVLQTKQWFVVDKNTYYTNEDGVILKSQWLYYKNLLVYVVADGSIAKSEIVKIGSKQYYFNSKGKRSKGFKKCKGKYYYCNSQGVIQKKKWITKSGKKYYLQKSGVRAESKLLKLGKYRYYFNAKGQMVKNKKVTYKDKIYKADKKGRCKYVEDVDTTENSPQDYTHSTEYTNEPTTKVGVAIE